MNRELVYTRAAERDLEQIFLYIAAGNLNRARTYVNEIRGSCHSLCSTPMLGKARPDLRPGLRILPLWRRVVVAYELPPGRVDVLRVFSGGQDYQAIMGRD